MCVCGGGGGGGGPPPPPPQHRRPTFSRFLSFFSVRRLSWQPLIVVIYRTRERQSLFPLLVLRLRQLLLPAKALFVQLSSSVF
eukprot:COSAG06_NODE_55579_length_289_cov_0.452632_1_plen_82_part_01